MVPRHRPALQASPLVHARPSLQSVPSGLLGLLHTPVTAEHVPAVWHWSLAVQWRGLPPTQSPDWQVSPRVQGLPSSQSAPSPLAGFEHVPVVGLHVPALWQASRAVHSTGLPPTQRPARSQVSVWVQAFPSLQLICC